MGMKNYMTNINADEIFAEYAKAIKALRGGYMFQGSVLFANLPANLTRSMRGFVYNMLDEFTTDARFIEGAGKKYSAGTNVAVADLSTYDAVTPEAGDVPATEGWYELVGGIYVLSTDTEVDPNKTYYELNVNMKFDVVSTFVNVDGIEAEIAAIKKMVTGAYDQSEAYPAGSVLIHNNKLYKLVQAHTADDDWDDDTSGTAKWDDTDYATEVTIIELIDAAEPAPFTTAQVNAIIGLLNE